MGSYDAPMFFACVVVTLLLAFVVFGSAMGKLQEIGQVRQLIDHVGMGRWLRALGFVELAGAIGLIVGLFWAPIGIAAADIVAVDLCPVTQSLDQFALQRGHSVGIVEAVSPKLKNQLILHGDRSA